MLRSGAMLRSNPEKARLRGGMDNRFDQMLPGRPDPYDDEEACPRW